jgi:hypothetical protein
MGQLLQGRELVRLKMKKAIGKASELFDMRDAHAATARILTLQVTSAAGTVLNIKSFRNLVETSTQQQQQ